MKKFLCKKFTPKLVVWTREKGSNSFKKISEKKYFQLIYASKNFKTVCGIF